MEHVRLNDAQKCNSLQRGLAWSFVFWALGMYAAKETSAVGFKNEFWESFDTTTDGQYSVTPILRKDLLPVEVSGSRFRPSMMKVDSMVLKWMPLHSAADLWGVQGSMALRQSVPGALSTLLYRGCSGNQNDLTWGDFALNNPMNRTMDLQLIPAWLFPALNILNGADAIQSGGYGIGGQIELRPTKELDDFPQQVLAGLASPWLKEISLMTGTSGERSLGLAIKYWEGRWYSSTRIVGTVNPNRYTYRNTAVQGSPKAIMTGADWDQKGILQHLRFQYNPRSYAELEVWAQGNSRGIPASMTSRPNSAKQNDSMLRIQSAWHHGWGRGYKFWVSQAYQRDLNRYLDTLQGISGLHQVELIQTRTGFKFNERGWQVQALVQRDLQRAVSSQYIESIVQERLALVLPGVLRWRQSEYKVQVQRESLQGQWMPWTLQGRWNYSLGKHIFWFEYRKAFNPPTFNDRFWVPGGNLSLKPELMYQIETGGLFDRAVGSFKVQGQCQIYGRSLRNKIWWQPQPNQSWWTPSNLAQSHAVGIEARLQVSSFQGRFIARLIDGANNGREKLRWTLSVDYQWNRTWAGKELSPGLQLPYIPVHKAWLQGTLHLKSFFGQVMVTAISSRWTTVDASTFLPPCTLMNAGIGYEYHHYRMAIGIRNIFNTSYQDMPWFPQPGSQAHFSVYAKF